MAKKFYVDSKELEEYWTGWEMTGCPVSWEKMGLLIYKMCYGVSTHFNPKDEDEHTELAQDALSAVLDKIKQGKLKNRRIGPVFSVFTTTIFNHLYSKKNTETRRRFHHFKFFWEKASSADSGIPRDLYIKCPSCGVVTDFNPFKKFCKSYVCPNCQKENRVNISLF